jgi:hypothetical protein
MGKAEWLGEMRQRMMQGATLMAYLGKQPRKIHDFARDVALDPAERAEIERAVEAVCAELGLVRRADERRERVASSIADTWRNGRRLPLNLVKAGFDAVGA